MKRNLFLFTILIFSFSMLFAVPDPAFPKKGHKNFHGKRMMEEDTEFRLLFIRAIEFPESFNFGLVFSQPVNPESINSETLLLNGNVIPIGNIRFSKNYRTVDFFVDKKAALFTNENIELIVKDVESINGNKIEPVLIKNFQPETDYKMMRKIER